MSMTWTSFLTRGKSSRDTLPIGVKTGLCDLPTDNTSVAILNTFRGALGSPMERPGANDLDQRT